MLSFPSLGPAHVTVEVPVCDKAVWEQYVREPRPPAV